jgi:hypothetical protein
MRDDGDDHLVETVDDSSQYAGQIQCLGISHRPGPLEYLLLSMKSAISVVASRWDNELWSPLMWERHVLPA